MDDSALGRKAAASVADNQGSGRDQHGVKSSMKPGLMPLLLRAPQAAALCGTSVRTWRTWNVTGKIPRPVRIGRSILWPYAELQSWVTAGCPDRATWEAVRE